MNKYQRDVNSVMEVLNKASNGLMVAECAMKSSLRPSDVEYVLDCLIEEGMVIVKLKGRLQIPIYSLGEK